MFYNFNMIILPQIYIIFLIFKHFFFIGCILNGRKRERLPSASPSGFLTAFGMTTYLMKKKGEERNGGFAAVSFLPVHFTSNRHFEWSERRSPRRRQPE